MILNRPLVIALALVGVCAVAAILAWPLDAPLAGAGLLAGSAPAIVVTVYEALRVLDPRADEATRRSTLAALALLLVPVVTLVAIAIRMGETATGRLFR